MEEVEEIDLKEIVNMFWDRKWIIIVFTIIFALLGFIYSKYMIKPDYKATASLLLTRTDTDNNGITQTDINLNQKLVSTYKELIKTNKILGRVIDNTGINITEESISVNLATNTQVIEITAKNEKPDNAKILADEMVNVFISEISKIYNIENITIMDEAKLPDKPYNINTAKNIVIFALGGMVLSVGYIFLREFFDNTIKNAEDAEKKLKLTVLASIPKYDFDNKKKGKK